VLFLRTRNPAYEKTVELTCIICQTPFNPVQSGGSPQRYCGSACRRIAEMKIRTIQSRLGKLWDQHSTLTHTPDCGYRDHYGRTHTAQIEDLEREIADSQADAAALLRGLESGGET
jgi:hypothetical protein